MLNQPTSSPMMTSMLGGRCCCAAAGGPATIPTATNASRAGQSFRMTFMENLLTFQGLWESANETTPQGIGLLERPAVFTGESLKATAQAPVSGYANAYRSAAARPVNGPSASVRLASI